MRRVVVTGLGAISPLGVGVKHSWQSLLAGKSGLVSTRPLGPKFANIPCQVAGVVPKGIVASGGWDAKEWLSPTEIRTTSTFTHYALAATEEAMKDAGWRPDTEEERLSTGVCLGSGIGNLQELHRTSVAFESGGYHKVSPLFVPLILINMAAGHISMKYGLQGPNHSATTACTTGNHSIGDAARFIACGDADVMIAGGAEACIHPLAIAGFARARSLATRFNEDPEVASRPFDKDRDGFVMGEGAGVLLLEELEHARARGANIYCEVKGYGVSADAYHITSPREDGGGAVLSMQRALRQAQIEPIQVDYVNAHATSTLLGDISENRAIKHVLLSERGKIKPSQINISSSKGSMGHLLGAAGAVESIFTILAVKHVSKWDLTKLTLQNILPPTLNLIEHGDSGAEFDCNYVPQKPQDQQIDVALTNSFGFGGTNATLCFAKLHD